jgi:sugar diacid utilization regulator
MQAALPRWLAPLQKADQKARGTLSATLKAYADANMNALQAAKDLGVHANTIYSRMQRISDVSGRNALAYHDLTELLLAIESSDKETGQTDV